MKTKVNIQLFVAIVAIFAKSTSEYTNKTTAVSILDYVKGKYDSFRPSPETDVVLMLGNTDSRKSSVRIGQY